MIDCLLLLISMLWHRQAIFESTGDKLSSSAECKIRTHQGLRHQIASRLNARWQTDWAIEDQAKTWTRQPVPMISKHSAHSTPQPFGICTWLWRYTCLSFRCSGKGKRYSNRKETSCLPLLNARFEPTRVSDTKSPADWMPVDKPTELSRIKLKHELDSPSLWSASIQPTRPHSRLAFAPGSGDIHVC